MCLNLAQFLIVSVLEDHHTLKKYLSKLCYKVKQEYIGKEHYTFQIYSTSCAL